MTLRFYTLSMLLLLGAFPLAAQKIQPFRGRFLMSFSEAVPGQKQAWPFECTVDITQISMEVKDDMNKKGVIKRILYNLADSSWLMLMQYNKIKQGTRIQAKAMFRDTMPTPPVRTKSMKEEKIIEGYRCRKYVTVSETDSAVIWIAPDLKFDLGRLYKMLSHCGMMKAYIDQGTLYYSKNMKGMALEVYSVNKKTGVSYTMRISEVMPDEINMTFFDLTGFKIADIAEGENCGSVAKDEKVIR
jgi:hypothetical protein